MSNGPGERSIGMAALLILTTTAYAAEPATATRLRPRTTVRELSDRWTGACTYSFVSGQFFEWNTDPTAIPGLFRELEQRAGIACRIDVGAVALDSPRLALNPLIILTGNRVFRLADSEIVNLRNYLNGGGVIYADDCGGSDLSFRRMLKQIVPDGELKELPNDHPIFSAFHSITEVPKIIDLYRGPARLYGLTLNGRLAVIYTYDTDLPCAWEIYPDGSYVHVVTRDKRERAFRMGVNIVLFLLSQRTAGTTIPEGTAVTTTSHVASAGTTNFPDSAVRLYRMKRQLPCDTITAIAGDEKAVWLGGRTFLPGEDEGLARYDRKTGAFTPYMDAEGVLAEEINALAVLGSNVLIAADTWKFSRGLSILDPIGRSWKSYTTADGLSHDRVLDIGVRSNDVWLACRSGLVVWAPAVDTFTGIQVPGKEHRDFMISVLPTDQRIWVNNFEHLWVHYPDGNRWTAIEDLTPLMKGPAAALTRGTDRVYIAPLQPATAPVIVYDEKIGTFSAFSQAVDAGVKAVTAMAAWQPFPHDPVWNMDPARELWLGTATGTVYRFAEDLDGNSRPVTVRQLGAGKIQRIHAAGPDVFVSVLGFQGVWHYNRPRNNWRQHKTRLNVPSDHLLSLAASDSNLFVGTLSDGPWSFEPAAEKYAYNSFIGGWSNLNYELLEQGRRSSYLGDRSWVRYSSIYDQVADGNRVWMASNHGLILHDPEQTPRGFEIITPSEKGPLARLALARNTVYCGRPDGGVLTFDAANRAWRGAVWTNDEPVTALAATDSMLWVGTQQHLYGLIDRDGDLKEQCRTDTGVRRLLAEDGILWIAAPDGIYRHTGTNAPVLRSAAMPIPNTDAFLVGNRQLLFAANEKGLWQVDPTAGPEATGVVYDLSAHIGRHTVTDMAMVGEQLYLASSGGGLLSIRIPALAREH